jgi:hypothetical protein
VRTSDALAARIRAAFGPISPYGFRLNAVTVDGRRVSEPSAYAGLLTPPAGAIPSSQAGRHAADWVRVDLSTARPTPWTPGRVTVMYDPVMRAVSTGGSRWAALPAPLADRIEGAAGLATGGGRSTVSTTWMIAAATLLTALFAAGSAELVRRSRGGLRREARS